VNGVIAKKLRHLLLDKMDVDHEEREIWQVFKPKNRRGARLNAVEESITQDGRWILFHDREPLREFYESETLR